MRQILHKSTSLLRTISVWCRRALLCRRRGGHTIDVTAVTAAGEGAAAHTSVYRNDRVLNFQHNKQRDILFFKYYKLSK